MIEYSPTLSANLKKILKPVILLAIGVVINSCSSVKNIAVDNDINRILKGSDLFSNQFTGFSLLDIETDRVIAGHNATLKFTPASNTKLLTMYAVLKSFTDSIPSFLTQKQGDELIIQPLGDPTFLYEPFNRQPHLEILNSYKKILISWPKQKLNHYGAGWAWDDYATDFQAQRSWWPIYGNTVSIKKENNSFSITPAFFKDYVDILKQRQDGQFVERDLRYNAFKVFIENDTSDFEQIIPFEYSKELLLTLLGDTLSPSFEFTNQPITKADTLYSQTVDRTLANMLKPSDNFMAEQLLILSAWQNGFKDIGSFIKRIQNTWLSSLTEMVWVDGSGLSRYNLISPIDQVRLLKISHDEFGWDRITSILPNGGEGTLKGRFVDADPYVFAKTGTLSNNHNLSGYLITKSGKKMIFSFMSNHYTKTTDEVKQAMDDFLNNIHEAY